MAASSSSDPAPPGAAAPPAPKNDARTATLVPQRAIITADIVGETTCVVNTLTAQVKSLPGRWELQFDEDGLVGVLLDLRSGHVRALDGVLNLVVVERSDRPGLHSMDVNKGPQSCMPLDELRTPFRQASGKIQLSHCAAEFDFTLACMKQARAVQSRIFWRLHEVYKFLKLQSHKGCSSKWIFKSLPRWGSKFHDVLGGEHIILGTYFHDELSGRARLPWHQRCLPATSISTCALMYQLAKWMALVPQLGGLRMEGAKCAAQELFVAMMRVFEIVPSLQLIYIDLVLVDSWQCQWPRPDHMPANRVVRVYMSMGCCDLELLFAACDRQRS